MALVAIGTEHGGSHLLQELLLYTHSTAVSPLLMAARACFSELYDGILSRALAPLLPIVPAGARQPSQHPALDHRARSARELGHAASCRPCEAPC